MCVCIQGFGAPLWPMLRRSARFGMYRLLTFNWRPFIDKKGLTKTDRHHTEIDNRGVYIHYIYVYICIYDRRKYIYIYIY